MDLSAPETTFAAFERAWRAGDLDVLARVFAAGELDTLVKRVEGEGRESVAEWYRRDADRWDFRDLEVIDKGQALTYLRAVLVQREGATGPRESSSTIVIALARVRGAWRITAFRREETR